MQENNIKVDGIGKSSVTIRNEALKHGNSKYDLYDEYLSIPIGSYVNITKYINPLYNNLNNNGILEYTHNGDNINLDYQIFNSEGVIDIANSINLNYRNNYLNYINYLNEVNGSTQPLLKFIDNILDYTDEVLAKSDFTFLHNLNSVGIVSDFNPFEALTGVNQTNINNLSNRDTAIGVFTNRMLAETLVNSSNFNTLRNTKYITPQSIGYYGMNEYNIRDINKRFGVDKDTGRINDIFGSNNVYINEIPIDGDFSILNLNQDTIDRLLEDENNNKHSNYNQYLTQKLDVTEFNKEYAFIDVEVENSSTTFIKPFDSLLNNTRELFSKNKIDSIINRFHTPNTSVNNLDELFDTATSKFGYSRGRNLLSTNTQNKTNGYHNPYCRVWTPHYGYDNYKKLIRPFFDGDIPEGIGEFQKKLVNYSRVDGSSIGDLTVLNNNGFVNITPSSDDIDSLHRTMFSIENLSWKDILTTSEKNISSEQVGPLGGRIMWFPPYNLTFNENVNVGWVENNFIGRGEGVYSYKNTKRSGTLSFDLIVDHPSIINYWSKDKAGTIENDEELLRFFAGCNNLELSPSAMTKITQINEQKETPKEQSEIQNTPTLPTIETETIDREVINKLEQGVIEFTVYYPNNYSGINDSPSNKASLVDAPSYLFCGWGTQINTPLDGFESSDNTCGYEIRVNTGVSDVFNGDYPAKTFKYRIDDAYINQKLKYDKNNYDNASGELMNLKHNGETNGNDITCSFGEMYVALNTFKTPNNNLTSYANTIGLEQGEGSNIDRLTKLFQNKDFKVKNVKMSGIASIHGYVSDNEDLARNRCISISNWLKEMIGDKMVGASYAINSTPSIEPLSPSVNNIRAKRNRSAKFIIEYEQIVIDSAEDISPNVNSINLLAANTNNIDSTTNTNDTSNNTTTTTVNEYLGRYDYESTFFKLVENGGTAIEERITEKIKLFNPAYHSMTPEGYNSRLTFLHQCTRQGHTIGLSDGDGYAKTAGNLAFGRPPFCVLRIGDFYNTKILIESMNIDFKPFLWDLNPEGVGVQPMIAQISLSFIFIGGSDIGGPIARLQNSASFNYYSNTSAYDNRADTVVYKNGSPEYTQFEFDKKTEK